MYAIAYRVMFICAAALALHGNASHAAELREPSGVVELFTSQGCSSCPPADRVLSELAKSDDVLALAWHVDYWDYLGWKDTFGSSLATQRQRAYAQSLGKRSVYTPQAIINGRSDVVGSRGNSVQQMLEEYTDGPNGITVPIQAEIADGMLKIRVDKTTASKGATLWMVYYDDSREVAIRRGENSGRTIRYHNIVRDIEMIGMIRDNSLQTEFALEDISGRGHDSCALILQQKSPRGTPGPIIGAAFLRDLGS